MFLRLFPIVLLSMVFSSCSPTPFNKEAIKMNNKATQLFLTNKDSALILFNKAIALDSSYHLPIQNKANLLISQKNYSEALETINLLISKKEYPEAWEMKGILIDKLGRTDDALRAYERSLHLRKERLKKLTSEQQISMENYGIGINYLLINDTLKGKELMVDNLEKSKNIKNLHDSLIKYAHDKNKLINVILNEEN